MKRILASAIGSGVVSGIWTYIAVKLGISYPTLISSWVGFVGITSFFVAGCGKSGFVRSVSSNLTGILIGYIIIAISSMNSNSILFGASITGIFTILICYLPHIDLLKFPTCTFMGGFSTFATNGNWKMLVICLIAGNIVGYLCVVLGNCIYKVTNYNKSDDDGEWIVLKFFD